MAGVKFKDADLMGMPIRLTVSPRNHKHEVVEMKLRGAAEATQIPYAELVPTIQNQIREMVESIQQIADAR
jgi:prolyl-tRNA synthetase